MGTPNLNLSYVDPAQAQKEPTINDGLNVLSAFASYCPVLSMSVQAPSNPSQGDCYIVPPGAVAPWTGNTNSIAMYLDGVWRYFAPKDGFLTFVKDASPRGLFIYSNNVWTRIITIT